ncbi:hypothetical protein GCM10018954_014190 [Kutzneria kofuensis]
MTAGHNYETTGVAPIPTADALTQFDAALSSGLPTLVPARLDTKVLRTKAIDGRLPSVLRDLVRVPTDSASRRPTKQLTGLPAEELVRVVPDFVRGQIATVLGHAAPERIEPDQGLLDMGFDSLTAIELRNRLIAATGLQLSSTLVFDYPTATALSDHLVAELGTAGRPDDDPVLAELDRLERALARVTADRAVRGKVGNRLRALLRQWHDTDTRGADDDLESATDEELFLALDSELGMDPDGSQLPQGG